MKRNGIYWKNFNEILKYYRFIVWEYDIIDMTWEYKIDRNIKIGKYMKRFNLYPVYIKRHNLLYVII